MRSERVKNASSAAAPGTIAVEITVAMAASPTNIVIVTIAVSAITSKDVCKA